MDRGLLRCSIAMRVYDAVNRMQRAMTYHRNRHSVVAGNIANLDTPGYKPMDLERVPESASINAARVARTHKRHLAVGSSEAPARTIVDDNAIQSADGNAVNIEREMAKIDANRVRYSTTADLVSRRLGMLRYAASDGQG